MGGKYEWVAGLAPLFHRFHPSRALSQGEHSPLYLFKALDQKRPGEAVKVTVARGQRVSADGAPDDVVTVNIPLLITLGAADDVRGAPPMARGGRGG